MNPIGRLLLVLRLLQRCASGSEAASLNKTQIHKLTYLAQCLGLGSELEFRMHHYGPYSFDLEGVLDVLEGSRLVRSTIQDHGDWAEYHVAATDEADGFIREGGTLTPDDERLIERVVHLFGGRSTQDLELLGTAHLVDRLLRRQATREPSRDAVVDTVWKLKPRFGRPAAEHAYDELVEIGMLGAPDA